MNRRTPPPPRHSGRDPQQTTTMKKRGYIYILANNHNNVLYIGVTNNIVRRITEHKAKINRGFTYRYNCEKLVYYESYNLIVDAIAREKQLKNWKREWKAKLISDFNPEWKDLSEEVKSRMTTEKTANRHCELDPQIRIKSRIFRKFI